MCKIVSSKIAIFSFAGLVNSVGGIQVKSSKTSKKVRFSEFASEQTFDLGHTLEKPRLPQVQGGRNYKFESMADDKKVVVPRHNDLLRYTGKRISAIAVGEYYRCKEDGKNKFREEKRLDLDASDTFSKIREFIKEHEDPSDEGRRSQKNRFQLEIAVSNIGQKWPKHHDPVVNHAAHKLKPSKHCLTARYRVWPRNPACRHLLRQASNASNATKACH